MTEAIKLCRDANKMMLHYAIKKKKKKKKITKLLYQIIMQLSNTDKTVN